MPADEADDLLLSNIRDGDADAWKEFIDRFEGRLMAFVCSRLGNRSAAEDVVQETFMGFLISLPNYDTRTPLESWLFAIAAHKLTDLLRREGRRPTLPLLQADSQGRGNEPVGKMRHASSLMRSGERRNTEEQIIGDCLQSLIEDWIDRGDIERLKCMELLFVLGYSNKATAEMLGITEQAVANHKHFVVSKLKDAAKRVRLRDFDLSDFGVR